MEAMKYRCPACLTEFSQGRSCPGCGFDGKCVEQLPFMQIGAVLKGRYRIGRVVHSNEESVTYLAFDREQKGPVYIEEFFPRKACGRKEDGKSVDIPAAREEIFLRGVKPFRTLFEKLKSSEVDGVLDVRDVFTENKTVYAAMRSGNSGTLGQVLRKKENPLSWNQAGKIFRPVLDALIELNEKGLYHYGISPDTLHLFPDGSMKLGGFHPMSVRKTGDGGVTDAQAGFAAPEQYQPVQNLTEAAEVYALSACILYSITGMIPKSADQRINDPRLLLSENILDAIPPFVIAALAGGLQVDVSKRTQTVTELRKALYTDPYKPVSAAAVPIAAVKTEESEELKTKMPEKTKPAAKQNKKVKTYRVPNFMSGMIAFLVSAAILSHVCINYVKNDPDYPYIDLGFLGIGTSSGDDVSSGDPVSSQTSSNPSSNPSSTPSVVIPEGAIQVPDFVGKDYETVVENKKFKILLADKKFSDKYDEGTIIAQSVTGYAQPGSAIAVTISLGEKERKMPSVSGKSLEEAREALKEAGFVIGQITKERNDGYPDDTVIRFTDSSIKDGKKYMYGTSVDLVISFRE